jgi:hypothetical protein
MPGFELEEVVFGFKWGPVQVERCMSDPKFGVILHATTKKGRVYLRVTPSGLIRIGDVQESNSNICDV